jgi:hypothetical protein|tara:strand:+ start:721 stop:1194 length:474 start_codon:yes stop_codon:yes gene_type:complete
MKKARKKKKVSPTEMARRCKQKDSNWITVPVTSKTIWDDIPFDESMTSEDTYDQRLELERIITESKTRPRETIEDHEIKQLKPTGARMKKSRAKELFSYGVLKKATAKKAKDCEGWHLLIDEKTLKTERGEDRLFKTLDALQTTAKEIGFNKMTGEW